MKTKIFALILCLTMLLTAILPMSVSAEEIELKNNPPHALAITEICAEPLKDGVSYQYIEITNLSTKSVDLSQFYVCRNAGSNGNEQYDYTLLQRMYGTNATTASFHKIALCNAETLLAPGAVAILWFTLTDSVTADQFTTYWNVELSATTKLLPINASAYLASAINQYSSATFLPTTHLSCIFSIVNKNYSDFTSSGGDGNTLRHLAAESSAIFYSGKSDRGTAETAKTSHNYYSYVDSEKYYSEASALKADNQYTKKDATTPTDRTVFGVAQSLPTFVVGKTDANGKYAIGNGLRLYTDYNNGNQEYPTNGAIFYDDGTKEAATPGTLKQGQFNYASDLIVYGAQNKVVDGTQTVRFVGYIGDVDKYTEVGFKVFAQSITTTIYNKNVATQGYSFKGTVTKEIDTVYKTISVNGVETKVGEITGTADDNGYLMAVAVSDLPLATDATKPITIYVTPYGVIDNGDGTTTTVYGKRVALDLEVFDALNQAN